MAHNINQMVYVGQEPWHGLGKQLPANGTYEEIVQAAGFYTAEERELFIAGTNKAAPDRKALVRADTGAYLSTVGRDYQVVQFDEVARTLVQAAGEVKAIFHTAGTLGARGAKGWLLGELPDPIVVKGDPSPIRKYLLGVAGHDGETAVTIKNVATRTVCSNTIGVALREKGAEWRIHHAGNPQARLEEAANAFRNIVKGYDFLGLLANQLAATRFSDAQMVATVDDVLPLPDDDKDHSRLEKDRRRVRELFEEAVGLSPEIRGTAWGAVQAWSEWADHHRPVRGVTQAGAPLARLESIWMGRGASLKKEALSSITRHAGVLVPA